jgi:hypothetical protein
VSDLYRPSNGTEGECFIETWCAHCQHDEAFRRDEGDGCPIVAATFCYRVDEPDYPREWTYNDKGRPICTAFAPIGYVEPDPNQLEMPL